MPEKYFEVIETIYKAMIFTAFTPTKWNEAKVIFIPKPGKSSHQIAKDFRPISNKSPIEGIRKISGAKCRSNLGKHAHKRTSTRLLEL